MGVGSLPLGRRSCSARFCAGTREGWTNEEWDRSAQQAELENINVDGLVGGGGEVAE